MHLRKYIKCLEIIINRQKCDNWSHILSNRRYLSSGEDKDNKDNDFNSSEKDIEINENNTKNELTISKQKDDKVIKAKTKLSNLLNEMKVDKTFLERESLISKAMAKPKYFIRKSARSEQKLPQEEHIDDISKGIDKRLIVAAKVIANTLSGSAAKETESELLQLLRLHSKETLDAKQGKLVNSHDLASVFLGMKVDKSKSRTPGTIRRDSDFDINDRPKRESLSSSVSRLPSISSRERRLQMTPRDRVNLYASEPLGIFDADVKESSDAPKMYIWDRLMKDELERIGAQPPNNPFEEMIRWTEQGKLWKYPIDNEQGLEEEQNVPFYDHVLLDHLLEGFPDKGPVRQFMELVLIGLSNNPYITVERKHATVQYYREYFKEKEDVLRASGALG